jgi:small-conductance mechanosensitive channel
MERASDKNQWKGIFFNVTFLTLFVVVVYYLYNFSDVLKDVINVEFLFGGILSLVPRILLLVFLFFIFKFFFIIFNKILLIRLKGLLIEENRFDSLIKLLKFGWWSVYAIIVILLLVNNIASIVASAGLIGLGLTFALQRPIMNFVGWLTIIIKDIYNEGDRIRVGGVVGDVKEIQLMNTVIYSLIDGTNTRSHKIMTVPNELILTTEVENYTKDSNYIKEELNISITYESDYRKAMKLLKKIVEDHIKNNVKSYIKKKNAEKEKLDKIMIGFRKKKHTKHSDAEKISLEKNEISQEIEEIKQLGDEFNPRIRLEMADSSLVLVAQFLTPYYGVKKSRSEINLAFLDAIEHDDSIEVAYPHLELISKDKKHGLRGSKKK